MLREAIGAALLVGLNLGRLLCQDPAAAARALAKTGIVSIKGEVQAIEGGGLPKAAVWVAALASPSRHLAETQTNAQGEFALPIDLGAASPKGEALIVGVSLPNYLEACDLVDPSDISSSSPLRLFLRSAVENYDEPDLDLVDAWLDQRLKQLGKAGRLPAASRRPLETALRLYQKRPLTRESLIEVVRFLDPSDSPPVRLLRAQALIRLGAWSAAGKMLAPHEPQDEALPEQLVLDGVRHNLLREPEEALRSLQKALEVLQEDPLTSLELGRAHLIAEDWAAALPHLDLASRERAFVPQARYLRTRALMSMGNLEDASYEAKVFLKSGRKKMPASAQSFMSDVLGRLEERSIRAIDSVMTQPLGELQKAVPDLAELDRSGAPPPSGLPDFLKQVGVKVEKFMTEFANTAAIEVIRQARLDREGRPTATRAEEFYYIFMHREWNGRPWLEEFRATREGALTSLGGLEAGYMTTSGFASSLVVFHPDIQPGVDFRFLGQQRLGGRPTYVIAFAQRPGESRPLQSFRTRNGQKASPILLQGIAWISADQEQILRMRTDLLQPLPEVQLSRETTDIDYAPHHFASSPQTFYLPTRVTVSVEWERKRLRNEHIFSRFWLFKVDVKDQIPSDAAIAERAKAAERN